MNIYSLILLIFLSINMFAKETAFTSSVSLVGMSMDYTEYDLNGDFSNNEISNLASIEKSNHHRNHMYNRFKDKNYRAFNKQQLIKAGKKSKEWHASKKGKAWHSKHAKEIWSTAEKEKFICVECGKEYLSFNTGQNKVCSKSCSNKYSRKKKE